MRLANIWNLGIKELRSLAHDPVMIVLIIYGRLPFQFTRWPSRFRKRSARFRSRLLTRISRSFPRGSLMLFSRPSLCRPRLSAGTEMDARMDAGSDTFAVDIPPDFERDVMAGRNPRVQLNVDATRMHQAFTGGGYIQNIIQCRDRRFRKGYGASGSQPTGGLSRDMVEPATAGAFAGRSTESEDWPQRGVEVPDLALYVRFNPNLERLWFGAVAKSSTRLRCCRLYLPAPLSFVSASTAR